MLDGARATRPLVTSVTSDHGEHFGEHRLFQHHFSVREPLLHVPLVIHGLPDVAPAVIDAPVELVDLMPTMLEWAVVPMPQNLAGRPLPRTAAPPSVPARSSPSTTTTSASSHPGAQTSRR